MGMRKPKIHLTPNKNWMNDPNGFVYYKEEYHLYYQYFPYECKWGTMHWGHATSKDLVTWKNHDITIYPSKEFDMNGCFSGTALIKDDILNIYYTGIKYNEINKNNIHIPKGENPFEASQVLIKSSDGYKFDNYENKKCVLKPIENIKLGDKAHTRDPKVWKYKDKYRMILGSKFEKNGKFIGEILFYESIDGEQWNYKNRYFNENIGDMWECPDIFKINNTWILMLSPENITNKNENYKNNSIYGVIDFDEETCEIKSISEIKYVDLGLDLYAPQTTISPENERILIGWIRMPTVIEKEDWIGTMTMPRIVSMKNGKILFNVVNSIEKKFESEIDMENVIKEETYKISAILKKESTININGYKICIEDDRMVFNRMEVFDMKNVGKIFKTPKLKGKYKIDIYVDNNIIETYINDGEYVVSNVIYSKKKKIEIENILNKKIFKMI